MLKVRAKAARFLCDITVTMTTFHLNKLRRRQVKCSNKRAVRLHNMTTGGGNSILSISGDTSNHDNNQTEQAHKDDLREEEDTARNYQGENIGEFVLRHGALLEMEDEFASRPDSDLSEDYDTDLEAEEPPEEFDATGRKVYVEACRTLNITPVSYFLRHIQDSRLDLKHRGLGTKGAQGIATALVLNTSVVSLNLHDNALEGEGGVAIADMLMDNCYISELDISSNQLGSQGCVAICEMLQNNVNLVDINLSNNGFNDKDTTFLLEAFRGNEKLIRMDLSHNSFSEKAGENLGLGITSNDSLEYLNLSWNHLRRKGATQVANGLRSNCTLKTVDLSFNGFGNEGAVTLGEAVRANNTLTELDISNNRITSHGALCVAKGLEGNSTLEVLKIGTNPIGSAGAAAILSVARNYCDSALTELHFDGINLDEAFDSMLAEAREIKPDLRVVGSASAGGKHPLKYIRRFITGNEEKWMELFQEYDGEGTTKISRSDFLEGLKKADIELGIEERARLLSQLDPKNEGTISYTDKVLGLQGAPALRVGSP